ncbi:MAG TPA: HD domain-containing protein [Anaerolineae bacterium]|nr:HD domain-containing protein [Anaerolineae bacterium]
MSDEENIVAEPVDRLRLWYRLRQGVGALWPRPLAAAELTAIETILPPPLMALFRRFDERDQRHSYAVWQTARAAGGEETALGQAALLHDVGKVAWGRVRVWERTAAVIVATAWPARAAVWGQGAAWWQRPLAIKARHAAVGADLVAAAGGEPLVVRLIAYHQTPLAEAKKILTDEEVRLLAQLQWADEQH